MKQTTLHGIMLAGAIACLACTATAERAEPQQYPIDKTATLETVGLYNRLFSLLKNGTMLGHQDDLVYGHEWYGEDGRSDVYDVTGDYPAIVGFDLGHIEIGADHNLDSVYFEDMLRLTKSNQQRGGIATFSWHANNIATNGTAWDNQQDTVVRSILPGGTHHTTYLQWLDRLADFFSSLRDNDGQAIPVIFRMFHEHTGAWFWWGNEQCTPKEYKELWTMTVRYLRDIKKTNNLLYAYSTSAISDEAHFLECYPGDDYVDIIGFDHYMMGTGADAEAEYAEILEQNIRIITRYASQSGKIPALTETGSESIPDTAYFTETVYPIIKEYPLSWILFWRNAWESDKRHHYYTPHPGHPSAVDFRAFANQPDILMNRDIQQK